MVFFINRLGILFLIICSLLLTTATSEAGKDRNETIRVGVTLDFGGPFGISEEGIIKGLHAYFDHFNKSGGAHGRPVKLFVYDNLYSVKTTLSNIQRLAVEDKVHIILGPFRYLSAVTKYAHTAGGALIIPFTPFLDRPPSLNFFSLLPSYSTQAFLAVDLIEKKLKKERVSVIYEDSEYGREVRSRIAERLNQYGKNMVKDLSFPPEAADLTPHVMKLIKSKPEVVVVFGRTKATMSILKASFNKGSKFQLLVLSPLDYNLLVKHAGKAAEGVIVCSIFPDPSYKKAPGIINFRKILRVYSPGTQPDFYNLMGFTYADVVSEVLRRAESISFEGLTKAFESLKRYDTGIIPQISFGREDRQAYKGAYFSAVEGLKWLTFHKAKLCEVYIRIESVPPWADVLEETYWGNLGNTGKEGFFKKDVCWPPRTYSIKVRKGSKAKKKSFDVDEDPEWIEWEVDLLTK